MTGPAPKLNLVGQSAAKLWGLPIEDWQMRAFKKAGASQNQTEAPTLHMAANWVLSPALAKGLVETRNVALVISGSIIGVNGTDEETAHALIGQSDAALARTGLQPVYPADLADGYNKALRKTEPPYALNIEDVPIVSIEERQFATSYKGITDFVTKWFWPVPAFHVTRACAALRLTPNMVTTASLILTLVAMYYFWQGQWALGFASGWLMTFLDTVDGKLARTTMTYSNWGNLYDHGIDLIHPPFWYFAWFIGLGGQFMWDEIFTSPLTFALMAILVGYLVDRIIEGIFIAQSGFHIHVWTRFNSALRFFIARRNPNTFILMIGILLTSIWANAGQWAFYTIAMWVWCCIGINLVMTIIGGLMGLRKPLESWMEPPSTAEPIASTSRKTLGKTEPQAHQAPLS